MQITQLICQLALELTPHGRREWQRGIDEDEGKFLPNELQDVGNRLLEVPVERLKAILPSVTKRHRNTLLHNDSMT